MSKKKKSGRFNLLHAMGLALSVLTMADQPSCHAQLYYSGGFIQKHRNAPNVVPPVPAVPKTPRDFFPDGDFEYSSFYAGSQPERPASSLAPRPLFGIAASAFPWNQPGFQEYNEPAQIPRVTALAEAERYALEVRRLSPASPAARRATALLIAHLPESAVFWVEGTLTRSTGRTRYFQSPPLQAGRKYKYTVRAAWIEDGRWVSQTQTVAVQSGVIQAIYLQSSMDLTQRRKDAKEDKD